MDETDLMALIAEGENQRLDFKQELELSSGRGKAEFIKDIISLANSAPGVGYLLVGVDDSKLIVGAAKLEEERIQQIASTYIAPAVSLNCYSLLVTAPNFPLVVVIEVRALRRPHKVARVIESLNQDDVFVRRGSVVARASPEEIVQMDSETARREDQGQRRIHAAETHVRLKNWKNAIRLYTQAIDEMPSAELLLARGKAYHAEADEQPAAEKRKGVSDKEWVTDPRNTGYLFRCAYKDYTDAITLTPSASTEKEARLGRMLLDVRVHDEWLEDVAWLKQHTSGREFGQILFYEQQVYYWRVGDEGLDHESVVALSQAIELGYNEAEVYFLRGQANARTFNFGLALQDFDDAIAKADSRSERLVEYRVYRAETLVEMKRYAEARETLLQAKRQDARETQMHLWMTRELYESCLVRWALQLEFHGEGHKSADVACTVSKIVALSKGLRWLQGMDSSCPGLMVTFREMVGENVWPLLEKGLDDFMIDIQVGNMRERIILYSSKPWSMDL